MAPVTTTTPAKIAALTSEVQNGYEKLKKDLRDIVDKHVMQRSGSLEWSVIYEQDDVQVLMVYACDNKMNYMESHSHDISQETFVVLKGKLEVNGQIVEPGYPLTIPPATIHKSRPLTADLRFLAILVPPELVYSK